MDKIDLIEERLNRGTYYIPLKKIHDDMQYLIDYIQKLELLCHQNDVEIPQ